MQNDASKYAIYWQSVSKDSDIAQRFDIPINITLPFFLDTEDALLLERKGPIKVDDYNLLVGLLVEYFTPPPFTCTLEMRKYFRKIIWDLLEIFQDQYGYNAIERIILVICADLKREYGDVVSRKAFRTGLEIFPEIVDFINKPSRDQ